MRIFSKKQKITFAKSMIAFAFILISLGTYVHLDREDYFIDPIKDTKVVSGQNESEEKVSINTTGDTVVIPGQEQKDKTSADNSTNSTNSNSNSQNNSNNSNKQNNTTNNTQNTTPNTPQPSTPPVVNTIDATNNNIRNNIQSTYGITLKYGAETGNYSVGGLNTIQINDANIINQTLNSLNYNLALYPTNFFREISSSGLKLTIYLIKRYSVDNVTGVTDSTTSNVMMSLATDYSFAESLNHEIYHYIDGYIYKRGGRYTTWNNLNPQNFSYGTVNNVFSYTRTGSPDAFFVNNYAQTDEYEDRASTFEYMMANSKASCLNYNKPIWLKAKYMSEQIDLFFNSVSPNVTEFWERYVY